VNDRKRNEEVTMLFEGNISGCWVITGYTMSGFVHVLLVIAVVVLVIQLLAARRSG
jgi:hypothetical protein